MKKGEQTRRHIICKSAELFNLQGYAGVSLNEIINATGIQKGGIYKHFVNKDEIAMEAFEYAADTVFEQFVAAVSSRQSAMEKLISMFEVYSNVVASPPFVGGCPVMNAAIEYDDGHPLLREKTQNRMRDFISFIKNILHEGITNGEFKSSIDQDGAASFLMAALEGGIMLSKLEADNRHMHYIKDHISAFLKTLEA
ncbi:TetR/AcrR family transcriptional regulator [Paenibacillus farraposensis]|uniref:TetR/AcrR family transcriptional regulator n=1 Tax=Paenibacillus farraposensis TaxID=2807095 RepID=A0ABW4DEI0_9BACL|nr:TetR/AcrR family transcriptional regulator [Paenibacillus farraposensis]MCC3380960.1 TetR/AcrR family transcriptional regulator [Paenibacillus farraposensis]